MNVAIRLIIQMCTSFIALTAQSGTSSFPHALCEVGILGTVLLRVYFGTLFPISIEIGSYLTDKEQKISWHSFFETRCSHVGLIVNLQCVTSRAKLPYSCHRWAYKTL